MQAFLLRAIGMIKVEEKDNVIRVSGLNSNEFFSDVKKQWNTSKIYANMFIKISKSELTFYSFFAIEVLYMLETIKENKRTQISKSTCSKIIEGLKEHTWISNIYNTEKNHRLDFSQLKEMTKTPLDYQMEFFEVYNDRVSRFQLTGYLLAAKPGTGKTYMQLALIKLLKTNHAIILSPKEALDLVWVKSVQELYKHPPEKVWVSNANQPIHGNYDLYICHYEALPKLLTVAEKLKGKCNYIGLDESHNMNELNSQRTQNFIDLCRIINPSNVVWASGTPLKSLGKEAIPLISTIVPNFKPDVQNKFKAIFGLTSNVAKDILANRLGMMTHHVAKERAIEGKPIVERIDVKIPNGKSYTIEAVKKDMVDYIEDAMKKYLPKMKDYIKQFEGYLSQYEKTIKDKKEKEGLSTYRKYIKIISKTNDYSSVIEEMKYCTKFERDFIMPKLANEDKKIFKDIKSIVKYLSLKVRGEALGRVLTRKRIDCHRDMIKFANLDVIVKDSIKKTVVFTSYVDVVKDLGEYFTEMGFKPILAYGETKAEIKSSIDKFGKDKNINPAIATFKTLATAIPLTMANTLILFNSPFREYEKEQAISRAFRLGQDTQVYVFEVYLDTADAGNISTRSEDILKWSAEQVEALLGSKGIDIHGLEFFDDIEFYN